MVTEVPLLVALKPPTADSGPKEQSNTQCVVLFNLTTVNHQ